LHWARSRRGPGVSGDEESLRGDHVGGNGEDDVREHRAGDEVDLVQAQVALDELLGVLGLELVVADQHLGRHAPSLPPLSFSARLKPSRMSPPIAAFGPDSVLMNRPSPCPRPRRKNEKENCDQEQLSHGLGAPPG